MALSADGRTAVSGAHDETVRVWDLATGECRATLTGHSLSVDSVGVSADGKTAVSGAGDDWVRVWDLVTGKCRATPPPFSPEANRAWESVSTVAALSARCITVFLEIHATGAEDVIARFTGNFVAADCSPDGRYVIAYDSSGQVHFLRLRSRDE